MAAGRFGGDSFNSIRGWVTEGTAANWPEGMASDILNMEINTSGEIRRRLGLVEEAAGVDLVLGSHMSGVTYSAHLWKDAGGIAGNEVLLIQRGLTVAAYGNGYPLSAFYVGAVQLPSDVSVLNVLSMRMSVTSVNGEAVIAHPACQPQRLVLNEDGTLSLYTIELQMRVQEAISTAIPNMRSTVITQETEFDLRNAGWPFITRITSNEKGTAAYTGDPLISTKSVTGKYPAISDSFYAAKTASAEEVVALDTYSAYELVKSVPPAGFNINGRFITSVYHLDTYQLLLDAASIEGASPILVGGTIRDTQKRPTCVGKLNGRLVYSGTDYNGTYCLFFSQMAADYKAYGKCYQEADPTAEEINDIIATDGGVIRTPGMGVVLNMVEREDSLLLFTTTGVWALQGSGDAVGFDATSFRVVRISSEACIAPHSIVELDNTVIYFGKTGIHAVGIDATGAAVVASMTRDTIQTFYDSIQMYSKEGAVGVADSTLGRIEWTLIENDASTYYTTILVYDAKRQGFSKHRVPYGNQRILLPLPPYGSTSSGQGAIVETEVVVTGGDSVTLTDTTPVVLEYQSINQELMAARRFRYLLSNASSGLVMVGEMLSTTFQDWYAVLGATPVDAAGYIECPYIYNMVSGGGAVTTKRSARASTQYINAYTLRGRLL